MQIIAEIGQAHEGSLGIAHSYIDALASTGVNVVKFQTHIAMAESSQYEPFRVKFSYEDKSRYDYWQRMEFTPEQWLGLKKHCDEKGLEFMSSPFSNAAVDLLEDIQVKRYKIGSGEVNNYLLLDKISKTGKPVILSSGMSSLEEISTAVSFLESKNIEVSLMQCTTAYPTLPENWGLHLIPELKKKFNIPIGFSDHSGDIFACLAATSLGAEILEFHVTFDKRIFGPDSIASLTIDQVTNLVIGIKQIEVSMNNIIDKSITKEISQLKSIFEKSLCVNKDLEVDHIIEFTDLEASKPKGKGINADEYQNLIGKKICKPLKRWEFLQYSDFYDD